MHVNPWNGAAEPIAPSDSRSRLDLVQWECFPDQALNWTKDIQVHSAPPWATPLTREQFRQSTGLAEYPDFLKPEVDSAGALNVYQNGSVNYSIRGISSKVTVLWRFEAPPGAGDTYFSRLFGSRAILTVQQSAEEQSGPNCTLKIIQGPRRPSLNGRCERR